MKDHKLEGMYGVLATALTPGSKPATCHHRCKCACHNEPGNKHMSACCTGCDEGHVQVDYAQLPEHVRLCHLDV